MDVIYTGLHRTPEDVVVAAVQEDVDILGVSVLSGAHMTILPRLLHLLKQSDAEDIILIAGGVIPDEDVPNLLRMGVARVLSQDTPIDAIPSEIRSVMDGRGA